MSSLKQAGLNGDINYGKAVGTGRAGEIGGVMGITQTFIRVLVKCMLTLSKLIDLNSQTYKLHSIQLLL